jgi:hypothetical protein
MPDPGAMSYMLSKNSYLNDQAGHWVPIRCFTFRRPTARLGV